MLSIIRYLMCEMCEVNLARSSNTHIKHTLIYLYLNIAFDVDESIF